MDRYRILVFNTISVKSFHLLHWTFRFWNFVFFAFVRAATCSSTIFTEFSKATDDSSLQGHKAGSCQGQHQPLPNVRLVPDLPVVKLCTETGLLHLREKVCNKTYYSVIIRRSGPSPGCVPSPLLFMVKRTVPGRRKWCLLPQYCQRWLPAQIWCPRISRSRSRSGPVATRIKLSIWRESWIEMEQVWNIVTHQERT